MSNSLLKSEWEVLQEQLKSEKAVLKALEEHYKAALEDIDTRIASMLGRQDANLPHVIRRIEYQQMVKAQVQAALDKLHANEYETISEYLNESYTDAFVGSVYTLHEQDVPVLLPIDQTAVVKAVTIDSKLKEPLYKSLGADIGKLKNSIASEVTRGIASSLMYSEIARNIRNTANIPMRRAKTIARTESGRVQEQATFDAAKEARAVGADVVKRWRAFRDGKTRDSHRTLDGQIREVDEPFEVNGHKAMHPHGFGVASEDINCRCHMLTMAREAFDEDELRIMQERAAYHGLLVKDSKAFGHAKAKDFSDFKKKYLKAAEQSFEYLRGELPEGFVDTRNVGEPIKQEALQKVIEHARLKGVQIGLEGNPTGGFETYCGDVAVLNDVIEQTAKQLESDLFSKSKAKKIILVYDNVLGYKDDNRKIDIGAFAATKGQTIILNKFMFDDSSHLKKEYAKAVEKGFFAHGTDHTSIIAHEAGHIIDKKTPGLYRRILTVIEDEAAKQGVSVDEYIVTNVSMYAADLNSSLDYHELVPEINSLLNSGENSGIIKVLKERGVI